MGDKCIRLASVVSAMEPLKVCEELLKLSTVGFGIMDALSAGCISIMVGGTSEEVTGAITSGGRGAGAAA